MALQVNTNFLGREIEAKDISSNKNNIAKIRRCHRGAETAGCWHGAFVGMN